METWAGLVSVVLVLFQLLDLGRSKACEKENINGTIHRLGVSCVCLFQFLDLGRSRTCEHKWISMDKWTEWVPVVFVLFQFWDLGRSKTCEQMKMNGKWKDWVSVVFVLFQFLDLRRSRTCEKVEISGWMEMLGVSGVCFVPHLGFRAFQNMRKGEH
jgi:hypothetical protein